MVAIDRIVCPINFSETSQCAFAHAVALARQCRARVTAVHVAPAAREVMPGASTQDAVGSGERLAHAIEEAVSSARREGVSVDPVVAQGDPVSTILHHARPASADLLVLGCRDAGSVEHLVAGSIAGKVASRAQCPVLTVSPGTARFRRTDIPRLARIICAVDFSEASLRALDLAFTLLRGRDSELTLLHVIKLPTFSLPRAEPPEAVDVDPRLAQQAIDRLAEIVPAAARSVCWPRLEVRAGNVPEEILEAADQVEAQAIIMGRSNGRERGRLGRLLLGSLVDEVASEATCPVIEVRGTMSALGH